MALTLNQINAITQKKFLPKLYDNIFDSNVLLSEMKKGEGYRNDRRRRENRCAA